MAPQTDLSSQKRLVKSYMKDKLRANTFWYVISTDWFMRWKAYVGFDDEDPSIVQNRTDEENQALHPGEIDNLPITSDECDAELKKGLMEGEQYELVPESAWNKLVSWYGGGPAFKRAVLTRGGSAAGMMDDFGMDMGGGGQSMTYVELYPLRFELSLCDVEGNSYVPPPGSKDEAVTEEGVERVIFLHFSLQTTFSKVMLESTRKLGIPSTGARYWVKLVEETYDEEEEEEENEEGDEKEEDDQPSEEEEAQQQQQQGGEGGEENDGWILVDTDTVKAKKLEVLVQNAARVLLMVEQPVKQGSSIPIIGKSKTFYPRDKKIMQWADAVQVGDRIDALDTDSLWFEAEVLDIKSDRSQFKVHYRGWATKWDDWVDVSPNYVAKLYTKTEDWRSELTPNSKIELKVMVGSKTRWFEGKVMEIDNGEDGEGSGKRIQVYCSNLADNEDSPGRKKWLEYDSEEICYFGTHLKKAKRRADASAYGYGFSNRSHTQGRPPAPGAVGLSNLGNTCFMNSMLQCLSNAPHLTEYFISEDYEADINRNNVLGTGGKLAKAYGNLMRDMWSGNYSVCIPSHFKSTIGEFAPQFAGYQQQDSQELMSYLMDGLHEDLNRIQNKPYTQNIESRGRDDLIMAQESWRRFLLRNDSKLVDHCYGLTKSHITCPTCGNSSTVFEPFLSLSLPIPLQVNEKVRVLYYPLPLGSPPVEVLVDVPMTMSAREFKELIGQMVKGDLSAVKTAEDSDSDFVVVSTSSSEKEGEDAKKEEEEEDNEPKTYAHVMSAMTQTSSSSNPVLRVIPDNSSISGLSPSKNYSSSSSRRSSSSSSSKVSHTSAYEMPASLQKYGQAVIFELEHKALSTYSSSSYSAYSSRRRTALTPKAQAVDVLFALVRVVKSSYSSAYYSSSKSYVQLRSILPSKRVSLPPDVTQKQVHQTVARLLLPWLKKESTDASIVQQLKAIDWDTITDEELSEILPYEIALCTSYGTSPSSAIPYTDKKLSITSGRALAVVFKETEGEEDDTEERLFESLLDAPTIFNTIKHASVEAFYQEGGENGENEEENEEDEGITLHKCLEKFSEREQLGETEQWYCSSCKKHVPPIKKDDIWAAPDVLILHLKRFQFVPGQYFIHRDKITDEVSFPIEGLDLSDYMVGPNPSSEENSTLYDCFAVSEHSGGLGGGHYTAVAQNFKDSNWYSFNDSSVRATHPSHAISPKSYVIFYKRRGASIRWAGINPEQIPDSMLMDDERD